MTFLMSWQLTDWRGTTSISFHRIISSRHEMAINDKTPARANVWRRGRTKSPRWLLAVIACRGLGFFRLLRCRLPVFQRKLSTIYLHEPRLLTLLRDLANQCRIQRPRRRLPARTRSVLLRRHCLDHRLRHHRFSGPVLCRSPWDRLRLSGGVRRENIDAFLLKSGVDSRMQFVNHPRSVVQRGQKCA